MSSSDERGRAPVTREEILRLDLRHVWHPYTSMDDPAAATPLVIDRAEGARLYDVDGREFLDGNSSWYVSALGHNHPRLVKALADQAARLCHTSLAGVTHPQAALLARELAEVAPAGLSRVFFSDDGSTAVEVAAKLAIQYFAQNGQPEKKRLVALEGAFHGDTVGAVSLGGVDAFRQAFASLLFDVVRVPRPLTQGTVGGSNGDGHAQAFAALEAALRNASSEIAAIVVEPVVQAAVGMLIYDPAYLRRLRALCDETGVLLIADEVFTGYGRTGPMWACEHAGISPDLLCTAKGFSGGMLPMAATLATEKIFAGFFGGKQRAFMHGHSYCGNPLGSAVAREVLAVFRDEGVLEQARGNAQLLRATVDELAPLVGAERCRQLGMVAAVDLTTAGYFGATGWRMYREGLARGAYLRPLGDIAYLTPPLNIARPDLERLCSIFIDSARAAIAAA